MNGVQKIIQEPEEKNIISQAWHKFFPYWPMFLIFLMLSLGGAWAYIRYKVKPSYKATASILIKDEKKGGDASKIMDQIDLLSSKKIIENEVEVLKSRQLMAQVVKSIHLYAPVYKKDKAITYSLYSHSPVTIQAQNPDSVIYSDKVFFTLTDTSIQFNNRSHPLDTWVNTPWGVLKFSKKTGETASPETPLYFVIAHPDYFAEQYEKELNVATVSKLSSVITLSIQDEDSLRAEDILNQLITVYNLAALHDKNTLAANTMDWVEGRLKDVAKHLDSIEKRIQNYKASQGAIDIGSQGNLYLDNVSNINQKLGDVNIQMDVLSQVENYVKSKDKSSGIVPSSLGVSDPLLSKLVNDLYDKEMEYDRLRKTTGENNPMVLSIRDQIDKLRPSIIENINNQKAGLVASKDNLNSMTGKYSSMLGSIPKKERDLVEISREQNILSNVYSYLLTKKQETELALSASIPDSRLIDKARSEGPFTPSMKIYGIAVIFAFALGIAIIGAIDLFRKTILFRQEIENFTSIPVVGEIAYDKSKNPIIFRDGYRTFVAEQFRSLRASLPYIGINKIKNRLMVTSTIPGEGKSFVVANVGMSLAMTGKKVIVLEFDLINPALAEKLNVFAEKGITDFILGNVGKEDIVYKTDLNENLFVVPAGTMAESPSELITSEKVPELLDYLSVFYDYIIIDTAPVGIVSDGYVLTNYCDATLYVVRHGHTPKVSIQRIDENNKVNQLKNIGIVFNGIKSRGFSRYGYGHGYGYGYGYVYQGNGKKSKRKNQYSKN